MKRPFAAALLSLLSWPAFAAVGTFVAAPERKDMVHDAKHGVVYIVGNSSVLRWQESTNTFLAPIDLGGYLGGIDISADDGQVAVADQMGPWIHLIDTATQAHRKLLLEPAFMEGGTYAVAYGADGKLYSTSTFNGSGWVPLRRIDTATDAAEEVASVYSWSMLKASGDGDTIAFAQSISDGSWGLVDIPTGTVVHRAGYVDGTGSYAYEVAVDPWGAQFSLPASAGAKIYNDEYTNVDLIGDTPNRQWPIAGAYDPVERKVYYPMTSTSEVRVYDLTTIPGTLVDTLDIGATFQSYGEAFGQGRTRLSRDGSLLMVAVPDGVRMIRQYAGLQAGTVYKTVVPDTATPITLPASIGGGKAMAWSISTPALHGTVSLANGVATYSPTPGYRGKDRFWYTVKYGRAVRTAGVSLLVDRVPVAVADDARTDTASILVPVLANDTDGDAGDTLSIKALGKPNAGSASIEGNQVRFVPPKLWTSPVYFTYTVTDGHDGEATATVRVAPTKTNAQPSHPVKGDPRPVSRH